MSDSFTCILYGTLWQGRNKFKKIWQNGQNGQNGRESIRILCDIYIYIFNYLYLYIVRILLFLKLLFNFIFENEQWIWYVGYLRKKDNGQK